jgi:hypothetical protein
VVSFKAANAKHLEMTLNPAAMERRLSELHDDECTGHSEIIFSPQWFYLDSGG